MCMQHARMHGVCSASLLFIDGHYSRGERSKEKAREKRGESSICSPPFPSYPYDDADADAEAQAPDLAGRGRARTMSSAPPSSSSKPPPHLLLHVDTATAAHNTSSSAAYSLSASSSANSSRSSPRPPAGAAGQNQACAACKYQRRKCNPDCPLARYFPADQQRRFLNAHRLFGVKNIQKTLRRIDPKHGEDAMRALIFQSDVRAADPVHGCVRIIKDLEHQLHHTNAELAATLQQIAIYRQAAAAGDPLVDPAMLIPGAGAGAGAEVPGQDNGVIAMDALYGTEQEPVSAGAEVFFHDQQEYHHLVKPDDDQEHPAPQQLYDYFCYDGSGGDEASSLDVVSVQQYVGYPDAGAVKAGSPVSLGEQLEQHCRIEAAPFVDAFDVKPQDLPAAAINHHGGADVDLPPDGKMAAVVKHDIDQDMTEPAPAAAAQCHLELGFSSSF